MSLLTFKGSNDLYLLVDENGRPSWFPHQVFEIVSNILPKKWLVKINRGNEFVDYQNLIGFNELCNKDDVFNRLFERDEEPIRIYFKRKIALEGDLSEEE